MSDTNVRTNHRSRSARLASAVGAGAVVVISVFGIATGATPAHAQNGYHVFGTGGIGVGIRLGAPSLSSVKVQGPPEGAYIDIQCQISGDAVAGSSIWDKTTWGGNTGYVPDAYIWTGYDGFDPRLPRCSTTPTPPPPPPPATSNAEKAARWAEAHVGQNMSQPSERNGNAMTYWSGWCETFAEDAYRIGAGRSMPSYSTATAHGNSKALNGGVPPRGALVFYSSSSYAGHVTVSVGNGNVVGTTGWYGQTKPIAVTGYLSAASGYRGWYLP